MNNNEEAISIKPNEFAKILLVTFIANLFVIPLAIGLPWWKIVLIIIVPIVIKFVGGMILEIESKKNEGDSDADRINMETDAAVLENTCTGHSNDDNNCGQHCNRCVCSERHDQGVPEGAGDEGFSEGGAEAGTDEG